MCLNVPFRLDTQTRFQALQQVSNESSATLNALQGDLRTLVMDYKDVNLKALGSFLDDYIRENSNAAREKRNCQHILKSLEFLGMDSRREQVRDAARDTFEWLLCEDSIPEWHDELEISPRQWLARGSGVYHITGKPGSGKSTLMKLIGESSEREEQLQQWAYRDQKQLINASFFVWRAADSNQLQNRIEGMLRTLLHQILTEAPGLIQRVFPERWHPERFHSNITITGTKLQLKEIEAASERIFGLPDLIRPYRIFLLIDGLDEFDDDHEAHFLVAKRIKDWCEDNPENVKACVSSREENPFMNTFLAHRRLRLHLVTHADIWKLTEQRLMVHPHFASSCFTAEQRKDFIDSISNKAEGVFLWAVLTIVELTHCLDANQDFAALCRVVDHGNKSLETFFKEALSRIPDAYREESRALFRIVQFTTGDYFGICLFHVYKAAEYAKATHHLAETVDDPVSQEHAVEELKLFKARLPIVTRGLLQLEENQDLQITSALAGRHGRYRLSFIHQSVFDFFQGDPKHIWGDNLADNDSYAVRLIIRSSIEIIDTLTWTEPTKAERSLDHDPGHWHWRRFIYGLFAWYCRIYHRKTATVSDFACLRALDAALLRRQGILREGIQFDSSQWSDVRLPQGSLFDVASIFFEACQWDRERWPFCDQFVSWALKGGYPDWIHNPIWKARVARDILLGEVFQLDANCLNERFIGVNEVLDANILPRRMNFSPPVRGSLWLNFLVHLIFRCALFQCDGSSHPADGFESAISCMLRDRGPALRAFLSNGAEPHVVFHWWSQGTNGDFGLEVTVGTATTRLLIQGPQWPSMRDTQLIRFFSLNFGTAIGTVTLRDICRMFYSLIDLNEDGSLRLQPRQTIIEWDVADHGEPRQSIIEDWDGIIRIIDNALSQDAGEQGDHCESYEKSEDQKPSHTPAAQAFAPDGAKARGSSSLDQLEQFLLFIWRGTWRKYQVLILPVLGKRSCPNSPGTERNIIYTYSGALQEYYLG